MLVTRNVNDTGKQVNIIEMCASNVKLGLYIAASKGEDNSLNVRVTSVRFVILCYSFFTHQDYIR